jgi:GNAT superfamily N-acetyltransferase
MTLAIRAATDDDLTLLARMNKHLIEDEGSRNPMSIEQLRQRMRGWLGGDWKIDLFVEEDAVVGYAVYQFRQDEYLPDKTIVYLRQMYIERDQRSRGLGSRAFELLTQTRIPADCPIVIDVLATNPRGAKFWSQVGFQPYCTTMHFNTANLRNHLKSQTGMNIC